MNSKMGELKDAANAKKILVMKYYANSARKAIFYYPIIILA